MIIIVVEKLPEDVWLATSPDLPGLIVEMPTKEEAIETAREVARDLLAMKPPYEIGSGGTTALPIKNMRIW